MYKHAPTVCLVNPIFVNAIGSDRLKDGLVYSRDVQWSVTYKKNAGILSEIVHLRLHAQI